MTKDCGIRNADCGFSRVAMQRTVPAKTAQHVQSIRIPHSKIRNGVTLIELLIVIAIIATLSTVFLGVSTAAMEHSRASRTKATIAKIHTLLMERWESYETRRVDVPIPNGMPGKMAADIRLLGLRELMKLEMPDRWSDIIGNSVSNVPPTSPESSFLQPVLLSSRPGLTTSYLRRYTNLKTSETEIIQSNQGAECLYMVVMLATGDGEARTLFGEQDIGDTDNDGAPEFLDGWGNSIQFIRWPAGYISDLQPVDPVTGFRLPDQDHDPFDVYRRDQIGVLTPPTNNYPMLVEPYIETMRRRHSVDDLSAFRLVPLIYSRGSDGNTDLIVDTGALVGLDPYARLYGSGGDQQLATVFDTNNDNDDNSLDNIHNHLQDNR